jgi:hypothetical protein
MNNDGECAVARAIGAGYDPFQDLADRIDIDTIAATGALCLENSAESLCSRTGCELTKQRVFKMMTAAGDARRIQSVIDTTAPDCALRNPHST